MKFLILSDLHASTKTQESLESRLVFEEGTSQFGLRFINYCKSLNIDFDFLVCPGDISNRGCPESFELGWAFLNSVKESLSIDNFLCVPGNHDLQSNPGTSFSPIHTVKFCDPKFPTLDFDTNTHFWGWNWSIVEHDVFNCLILNTSAYHGVGQEYKHGRIAPESITQITKFISSSKFKHKLFNVLLCHHHPLKREDIDFKSDYEVMDGGQVLLKSLEESTDEPWLVIHGHKHFASLFKGASSGFNPPLIFSAGSFSAKLYPEIQGRTENQFYILDVNLNETKNKNSLVGTFETHSWSIENDWHPSKCNSLPHKGGFGSEIPPYKIIEMIRELLQDNKYLDEKDLSPIYDILNHYTPRQFDELINKFRKEGILYELDGNTLIQVAEK